MHAPHDLLNPRLYDKVRLPALEAETLPAWCYTSKEWFDLEVEHMFRKSWNFIGHDGRIPNPGDYFTMDFTGIPIIVVRGRDGVVRCFANSCRHRGAQVLQGEGNCKSGIKCPYHGWVYGADGRLTGAIGMEAARNFDKAENGLIPVRLEMWANFMFIHFEKDAAPLSEWLGDLPAKVAPYEPEKLALTRRQVYDLKCNWKLYVENFKDLSHTKTVHKDTLYQMEMNYTGPLERSDGANYHAAFTPHEGSRAIIGGVGGGVQGFPPIKGFTDGTIRSGSFYPTIFPTTCFGFCIDSAWFLEMYPSAPDRMQLVVGSMFYEDTLKRPDFEEIVQLYYKRMDIAVPEDNNANENTQAGLRSPHSVPGRMGEPELSLNTAHNYWLDKVLGPASQRRPRAA
jgi:choline monooxygenase